MPDSSLNVVNLLLKALIKILLLVCAASVIAAALLIFFGISDEPDIKLDWTVSQADITRAKTILHEGSKTKADEVGTITLNQADIDLVSNYLLNRFTKGRALISLQPNKLKFVVAAALPNNRLGKYINITFRLGNEDNNPLPTLTKFKAGKLLLPSKLAAFAIQTTIKHSRLNEYVILATDSIQAVNIEENRVSVTYQPNRETLRTARDFLTHGNTNNPQASLYENKLAEIIRQHDPNWRLSLADILRPLFVIALSRSTPETAVEENRTIIFLVNNYVNSAKTGAKSITPSYPAFLYKRIDLAQHFIGAAAITASVNSQIAQVMGEEKEIQDAKSGSGFSFVDLCADRAGTRFGELATASPESALKLQRTMSAIKDYSDFMPDPRDLPEQMNEAAFKQRYGSVNSKSYKDVSKLIDALIAATPIYRNEYKD